MTNNNTFILLSIDMPVKCSAKEFITIYNERYKNKITHEFIRYKLGLADDIKLKLNGTFKRNIYLLDENNSLYKEIFRVQTAIWYDPISDSNKYVSIFPSFIKKYCPISINTLEYIGCNTGEDESIFKHIDDSQGLFDCEEDIVRSIELIEKCAIKHKYSSFLNSKYTEVYNKTLGKISDEEKPRKFKVIYELILMAKKHFGLDSGALSRTNTILIL